MFIITLGFYSCYWVYKTQEEVKQHTGDGLGGVLGLVVWIVISAVSAFVIPSEIGRMYQKDGQHPPVTGWTGLWLFPFGILIIPAIVWFVKMQELAQHVLGSQDVLGSSAQLRPKPDRSRPGTGVHATDPRLEPRVPAVQGEVLPEDEVELVGVGLVVDEAVLEERKRRAVGRRELPEEVVAPGEQPLEELERPRQLPAELVDPLRIGLRLAPLRLDLVRRPLPDPVEPVEEDVELGTARLVLREERRLRLQRFEVAEDDRRVRDHDARRGRAPGRAAGR